jgi:major membrane immunogen (membrane-anchored lipoprotein)
MKKIVTAALISVISLLAGCESKLGNVALGGAGGAAAGVGGYEWHFKNEKDKVEQAFKDGRIDQREYDIRIDQIRRDSLFQK